MTALITRTKVPPCTVGMLLLLLSALFCGREIYIKAVLVIFCSGRKGAFIRAALHPPTFGHFSLGALGIKGSCDLMLSHATSSAATLRFSLHIPACSQLSFCPSAQNKPSKAAFQPTELNWKLLTAKLGHGKLHHLPRNLLI